MTQLSRATLLFIALTALLPTRTDGAFAQPPGLQIVEHPQDVTIPVGTNTSFSVSISQSFSLAKYQWFENGIAISGATQRVYITRTQTIPTQKIYTVAVHLPNPYLGNPTDPHGGEPLLGAVSEAAVLTVLANLEGGLLAHWSFDENFTTNALDRVGSYHGRVVNGTRIAGPVGSGALQLNGQDAYMFVGGIGSPLQLTNSSYTLSWWQRWDGPTAFYQDIISMDDGANYSGGYQVYLEQGDSQLSHVHANPQETVWRTTTHVDGIWRHYAITFDGTARRLHVDGVFRAFRPTTGPVGSDGDDPLVIGALALQSGTVVNFFNGALDEIRMYNRALAGEEIAELGPEPEIIITQQPVGVRVGAGSPASLSVEVSTRATSAPARYQWESNRVAIAGATNASLNVTGTSGAQNYRVLVSAGNLQEYSDEVAVQTVAPGPAGLLLHLEFEGSTNGVFAESTGNFEGIQGNAALVPGRVGTLGASLSSDAFIRVPAAGTDLELVGSHYTIAWWMKPLSTEPAQVFSMGPINTLTSGYGAQLVPFGGNRLLRTEHRNGHRANSANFNASLRSGTNWVHLAIVYNGVSRTIYTNGVSGTNSYPTGFPLVGSGRDDLIIGSTNGTIAGIVDDFRIYNYALASDEIAALASVPEPPANLTMSVSRASANVMLSWPVSSDNHRIEYADVLGSQALWTPLNVSIERSDFTYRVLQPVDRQMRFYRLRRL